MPRLIPITSSVIEEKAKLYLAMNLLEIARRHKTAKLPSKTLLLFKAQGLATSGEFANWAVFFAKLIPLQTRFNRLNSFGSCAEGMANSAPTPLVPIRAQIPPLFS